MVDSWYKEPDQEPDQLDKLTKEQRKVLREDSRKLIKDIGKANTFKAQLADVSEDLVLAIENGTESEKISKKDGDILLKSFKDYQDCVYEILEKQIGRAHV